MRYFITLLFLFIYLQIQAQENIPYIKTDYGFNTNNGEFIKNYAIEFTHLKDQRRYYSGTLYGYTTGIQLNNGRLQIPFSWTAKASEWNDILRLGVIFDQSIERLDLYGSIGFDNQILRYRTDGWLYSTETYFKYNKYRSELGLRLGIGFTYDKYHYHKWYKNY